jgi:hypothetical protein
MNDQGRVCLQAIINAYQALEVAKSDCEDSIGAAIDTAMESGNITDTEIKYFRKIGKAIADGKLAKVATEALNFADFLQENEIIEAAKPF